MAIAGRLSAFRAGFPALQGRCYLATAGGAPISRAAAAAARRYVDEAEALGDAPFADWLARTDTVRGQVAALINARPEDIAFLASASVAMNVVAGYVDPDATIVTIAGEFPSVTLPWINRGHTVLEVAAGTGGAGPIDGLAAVLTPDVGAIVLSHVQFRTGRSIDLDAVGRLAERVDALVIVDATQSMGAVPIDVEAAGVSVLMASGYKWLCAGYGIGAVYVAPKLRRRRPPVFGWRSAVEPYALDPRAVIPTASAVQLEMGHPPFAPAFCLGGALHHLDTVGLPAVWERIQALQSYLRRRLAAAGLPAPLAPAGESGIAVLPTERSVQLKRALAAEDILVSSSGPYLRLSTHAFNTEAEIDHAVGRLRQLW